MKSINLSYNLEQQEDLKKSYSLAECFVKANNVYIFSVSEFPVYLQASDLQTDLNSAIMQMPLFYQSKNIWMPFLLYTPLHRVTLELCKKQHHCKKNKEFKEIISSCKKNIESLLRNTSTAFLCCQRRGAMRTAIIVWVKKKFHPWTPHPTNTSNKVKRPHEKHVY